MLEFGSYEDHDVNADPIVFLSCGHFYSMSTLDGIMELEKAYEKDCRGNFANLKVLASSLATEKPKTCPDCRSIILGVKRYGHIISFLHLRDLEMKHMMSMNIQLQKYSRVLAQGATDDKLNALKVQLEALETNMHQSPMRKVYEACRGKDLDVPVPPTGPFLELMRLKAFCVGGLVAEGGDDCYKEAKKIYKTSIILADVNSSKRFGSQLRLDLCKLVMRWNSVEKIRRRVVPILDWVITEGVDDALRDEAKKMKSSAEKNELEEVLKAMNVVQGYDYGGGWSDHWYECPNGHPYFIGECGGAMQVGRCIECGEQVGGSSHTLLASNQRAGGAIAEAMRG